MEQLVGAFFSAVFLFNAVPHLVRGICGKRHMTPFSRSSGPAINVIWGWVNFVVGAWLIKAFQPQTWLISDWGAFFVGGFIISISLAVFWSNPDARLPWHGKK